VIEQKKEAAGFERVPNATRDPFPANSIPRSKARKVDDR
jgi:hypothetical protein